MATMTLTYDARNTMAQHVIDFICSLRIFNVVREDKLSAAEKKTLAAIKEIENGGGTVCETFDDYLKAIQ